MATIEMAGLLALSAVMELIGTLTVAFNYWRGSEIAARLAAELQDEREQDDFVKSHFAVDPALLKFETPYFELVAERKRLRALRTDIGSQLARRWYLTAGLAAYVVGALAGLAGGLLALYR